MEFVEEESRPRFLLHSRSPAAAGLSPSAADPASAAVSKPHAATCVAAAALLLAAAFYSPLQSQTLTALLVWVALSLVVAPFAPPSITGGDVRVGLGEPLAPPEPEPLPEEDAEETRKRNPGRRSKARRPEDLPRSVGSVPPSEKKGEQGNGNGEALMHLGNGAVKGEEALEVEEREWNEEDFEILKKQIAKLPVGTPRRWERIAEAFRGRHGVESVIRMAKSLQEKRPEAGDSFAQFLRQRKPLDKRAEGVDPNLSASSAPLENGEVESGDGNSGGGGSWSSGEDIALLNALKAFPKDAPMRWEKIAAAVPGRSKAACMRRVTELKRDFRSMKASEA